MLEFFLFDAGSHPEKQCFIHNCRLHTDFRIIKQFFYSKKARSVLVVPDEDPKHCTGMNIETIRSFGSNFCNLYFVIKGV